MLWSIVTSVIDSWALVIVQPWSAATCQRMIWLVSFRFPSSSSRRYTKVLGVRHSGMDAGIQSQGCEPRGWQLS